MKLFGNFWVFFGNCWGIFGIFLKLLGNFSEGFFWKDFLGGFFWEDFLGGFFGRIIGRNSLFTLELTCLSRFWFSSRFWGNGEGRKEGEFQSLEVRLQAHRT